MNFPPFARPEPDGAPKDEPNDGAWLGNGGRFDDDSDENKLPEPSKLPPSLLIDCEKRRFERDFTCELLYDDGGGPAGVVDKVLVHSSSVRPGVEGALESGTENDMS